MVNDDFLATWGDNSDRIGKIIHGLAPNGERLAFGRSSQGFSFKIRLLHKPVRQTTVEIDMGTATFKWSRDNGSIASVVTAINAAGDQLTVSRCSG